MEEIKAPTRVNWRNDKDYVFLAGTIDNGNSEDWQEKVVKALSHRIIADGLKDFVILNPRRENWDPTWEQNAESPQFFQQVSWEMDCMDEADIIIMYFVAGSKSPITLLELGLYADSKKLVVCCPEGFWRSGNVEMVCNKYRIPLFRNIDELVETVKNNK